MNRAGGNAAIAKTAIELHRKVGLPSGDKMNNLSPNSGGYAQPDWSPEPPKKG